MVYQEKYLPVDPDFIDILEELITKKRSGKVHFFEPDGSVGLAEGKLINVVKNQDGVFLKTGGQYTRIDLIITVLGRPGPAYELYDRYANVCFTCENLPVPGK